MKKPLALLFLALSFSSSAFAQAVFPTANGRAIESLVIQCVTPTGSAAPCSFGGLPVSAVQITGNASGSVGAVVGTLAAAAAKTTYICGFSIDSLGGTASTGPITLAGLVGSSMVFQLTSSATGSFRAQHFTPCLPASAVNTAITITTTANATATAVNVNSWGYRQ